MRAYAKDSRWASFRQGDGLSSVNRVAGVPKHPVLCMPDQAIRASSIVDVAASVLRMPPVEILFTLMRYFARSCAITCVSGIIPPFAAEYPAIDGLPRNPSIEA